MKSITERGKKIGVYGVALLRKKKMRETIL